MPNFAGKSLLPDPVRRGLHLSGGPAAGMAATNIAAARSSMASLGDRCRAPACGDHDRG